MTTDVDVLILGGGLAGGLLARHLRRALPSVSVGVVERRLTSDWKVGESTVELAGHYLVKRLGLSSLLYREHLPKNGLRFFFDQPGRDAPIPTQSELGTTSFAVNPSFQVDRARLEERLLALAVADGVTLWRGAKVTQVSLGEPHETQIEQDGAVQTVRSRWVVDASGRSRLLARKLGLTRAVPEHQMIAAWGRVHGLGDLDALGDEGWRARARHTSRMLSTTHLNYPGYWIWLIPLRDGLTSVGVVGVPQDQGGPLSSRALRSQAGFFEFLKEHKGLEELLRRSEEPEGARLLDHGAYLGLAHRSERYFSPARWALVGEAGSFTDPFYSPGSDFIAQSNDLTVEAIRRDLAGEDLNTFTELASGFIQHQVSLSVSVYRDQYMNLGSYDLFRLRYLYDLYNYFNLLTPYAQDAHLDPAWLRERLNTKERTEGALAEAGQLFAQVGRRLQDEGRYFSGNQGGFDGHFDRAVQDPTGRSLDDVARTQRRLHHGVTRRLRRWLAGDMASPPSSGWMAELWAECAAT
ncbi:MAG: tryptophan 7-halogenase [Deltaproteobacteria bacterium]|nr:tryptophan 7-halogenase [Deltaproteobacteria bacterium]